MKNAVRGKKAFAYTHHTKLFPAFNAAVSLSREDGFTINLSIDNDEKRLGASEKFAQDGIQKNSR